MAEMVQSRQASLTTQILWPHPVWIWASSTLDSRLAISSTVDKQQRLACVALVAESEIWKPRKCNQDPSGNLAPLRINEAWAAAVPHGFESKSKDSVNVIEVYETGEQGGINL